MNRLKSIISVIALILSTMVPPTIKGQDFTTGVCRLEGGRIIFRIDLNWTQDQLREVSGKFDLDTSLLSRVLTGHADSLLLAGGWQWKKINSRTAELSRDLANPTHSLQGPTGVVRQPRVFLLDEKLTHVGFAEPETADYGINVLKNNNVFAYSDSVARFYLPGFTDARQIFLSGSFNEWSTMQTPMRRSGDGWEVSLILMPGKYQYKFIVDGHWTRDPNNQLRQNDLNGGFNSVIFCYNYKFHLPGYGDAKAVFVSGSFNGFKPDELAMQRVSDGWDLSLFLKSGTHAYKFVVDGNWITDPDNPVVRPDGHGNMNSFIGLGHTTWFRLKGFESATSVILAGSFNAWNTKELSMERTDSCWQLPYVLAPGNYEYKFIADGHWLTDPGNPYLTGEGGKINSFLAVEPNHTFVLDTLSDARRVCVSGSFNNWSKSGYPMIRRNNQWELSVYLRPGKYIYKMIVDGRFILDPGNELWEENEFGTGNSVIWINQ